MIVIFANRFDSNALSLTERWKDHGASLLTCADLSVGGWLHQMSSGARGSGFLQDQLSANNGTADHSIAMIGGRRVPSETIEGVLIRWPGVFPQELTHIAEGDRDYVSREMMAFLVSWFSSLACPVINRPTPVSLIGPPWRREQWIYAAGSVGLPVEPIRRDVMLNGDRCNSFKTAESGPSVIVAGERSFGDVHPSLAAKARELAEIAGVELLEVSFTSADAGACFRGANLVPSLSNEIADEVLGMLTSGKKQPETSFFKDRHDTALGTRWR